MCVRCLPRSPVTQTGLGCPAGSWEPCHRGARCLQVLAAVVVGRRSLQEEPGGLQALHEAQALHKAAKALCKVRRCVSHFCRPIRNPPRTAAQRRLLQWC